MKQTAVEWLVNCIESMNWGEITTRKELYDKAKAMEKEQIVEAYRTGVEEDVYERPLRTGKQYYNETFKSEQ